MTEETPGLPTTGVADTYPAEGPIAGDEDNTSTPPSGSDELDAAINDARQLQDLVRKVHQVSRTTLTEDSPSSLRKKKKKKKEADHPAPQVPIQTMKKEN